MQITHSEEREFSVLPHRADAIEAWARSLRQRFAGQPVALCLEIAKGPFVYALQKYDFLVLLPVNPATLAKYRQAFTPSTAKADPSDAELALELLLRYPRQAQAASTAKRSHARVVAADRTAPPPGG